MFQIPFALGEVMVGLIALLVQQWDELLLTLSFLTLPCVAFWFILPESPRSAKKYIYVQKHKTDAILSFTSILGLYNCIMRIGGCYLKENLKTQKESFEKEQHKTKGSCQKIYRRRISCLKW